MRTTTFGKLIRNTLALTALAFAGTMIAAGPAQAANIYPCTAQNTTDVPIVDNQWAMSPITMPAGCSGLPMSTGAVVEVQINHSYIGDLKVQLVPPDGSAAYTLHNYTGGNGSRLFVQYPVTLIAAAPLSGPWRLLVFDQTAGNTGVIDTWKLTLHTANFSNSCIRTITTPVTLTEYADKANVPIGGCAGRASKVSSIEVVAGDFHEMELVLIAPDGSRYMLHERYSDQYITSRVYTLDLSSENANGTWRLEMNGTYMATLTVNRIVLNLNSTSYGPLVVDQTASVHVGYTGPVSSSMSINQGGYGSYWSTVELLPTGETTLWNYTIELVSPDGSRHLVHRFGLDSGVPKVVRLNLTSESRFGTWRLDVAGTCPVCLQHDLQWKFTM